MPEVALSEMAVYTARPTVRVDGQAREKVSELVIGMEMTENEGGLSALELRMSNVASDPAGGADLAFEDDRVLRLGATIEVYGGGEGAPPEVFPGLVPRPEGEVSPAGPPALGGLRLGAPPEGPHGRR